MVHRMAQTTKTKEASRQQQQQQQQQHNNNTAVKVSSVSLYSTAVFGACGHNDGESASIVSQARCFFDGESNNTNNSRT